MNELTGLIAVECDMYGVADYGICMQIQDIMQEKGINEVQTRFFWCDTPLGLKVMYHNEIAQAKK